MPKMIVKYGSGQRVEVKQGDDWIPGVIHRAIALRLYQVSTDKGYLTVRETDIREGGTDVQSS